MAHILATVPLRLQCFKPLYCITAASTQLHLTKAGLRKERLPRSAFQPNLPACPEQGQLRRSLITRSSSLSENEHENEDVRFMQVALQAARDAAQQGEVPVGCVMVLDGKVIAAAHNQTEQTGNPVAHAEMLCIQQAALKLGGWRLLQCTMYITLEPCPMCAGALLQSRVGTVVYGGRNTLLGADGSWVSLLSRNLLPAESSTSPKNPHPFHRTLQVRRGILATECSELMQDFFRNRRIKPQPPPCTSLGS